LFDVKLLPFQSLVVTPFYKRFIEFLHLAIFVDFCNNFGILVLIAVFKFETMETQNFLKSKQFKILLPFVVILGIIIIARAGFDFGEWLKDVIN